MLAPVDDSSDSKFAAGGDNTMKLSPETIRIRLECCLVREESTRFGAEGSTMRVLRDTDTRIWS